MMDVILSLNKKIGEVESALAAERKRTEEAEAREAREKAQCAEINEWKNSAESERMKAESEAHRLRAELEAANGLLDQVGQWIDGPTSDWQTRLQIRKDIRKYREGTK